MMNRFGRWLSTVALITVALGLPSILTSNGWAQERAPATEEEPASVEPETPSSEQETPTATEEILAPLEETSPPPPETMAIPSEEKVGPRKYTVKEGDTLWGISDAFLKDSFLWPKVWKTNPTIFNPDLIYPGNVITLPSEEAIKEMERVALVETAQSVIPTPPPAVEQPTPMEPVEVEKPIEIVVPEETQPPAVKPLDLALLASSGYILTGQRAVGTVVGARDNREILGEGETAYLLPTKKPQPQVGDRFTVYRIVRKVYHPRTGKYLGDLVRILGTAEVTGADPKEKTVTAKVLNSYDYIQNGDALMPYQSLEPPAEPTEPPSSSNGLKGHIVEVKENRASQAQFDVVYLDRGRQDGVQFGSRFQVIRDGDKTSAFSPGGGVRLPRRVIGELQIIAVQDATSTAKVIKSTEVIYKGDRFETRPTP